MVRKIFAVAWLLTFAWLIAGAGGCAANRPVADATASPSVADFDRFEQAQVATALVFDPMPSPDSELLDLSRAPRQRGAFIGFEEQTTSFYYLQVDDHQLGGRGDHDRYDRHAYVERFGSTTR